MIDAERERDDGLSARGAAGRGAQSDPLATALMPVLLHDLNNATQYLTALNALLSSGTVPAKDAPKDAPRASPAHLAGLSHAARTIEDLGWVLGLAANAGGADLLLERRQRAGLEPLVLMVRKCLRREERDLDLPARDWPECAAGPDGVEPWRVPWAIGTWLLAAGRSLPPRACLSFELRWIQDHFELICRAPMTSELETTARRLASAMPGLATRAGAGECALRLAPGWLVPAEASR